MFYNWSTIYVSDAEKSYAFYHDLFHLPLVKQIGEMTDETCVLFLGEEGKTQFEIVKSKTVPQPSASVSFGFTLDNLEEVLEACKDSAALTPNQKFWMVKDPDGYLIQLKNTRK